MTSGDSTIGLDLGYGSNTRRRFSLPFFLDGNTTGLELNHPGGKLSDS